MALLSCGTSGIPVEVPDAEMNLEHILAVCRAYKHEEPDGKNAPIHLEAIA